MNRFIKTLVAVVVCISIAVPLSAHNHKHKTSTDNIVETAAKAGNFETLLAAATAAGLVPALTGEGPITVFAPTDAAFGALPASTIATLLKEENQDALKRILTYHVVSGAIGSDALADKASLQTLAGPAITFVESEQGFTVEGALIQATDIQASNGIVHVIDRVIMPPAQMSRVQAQSMIRSAISKGVPMFNHGNPQATVKVYTMAARSLLDSANLHSKERERLQEVLQKNSEPESPVAQAWNLRYALDDVMSSLQNDMNI